MTPQDNIPQPLTFQQQLAAIRNKDMPKTTGPKPKKYLNKVSPKKQAADKAAKELPGGKPASKLELDVWFDNIRKEELAGASFTGCWECGAVIPEAFMRHATAHLLPKKIFKSCATHPLNYMIYGAGCGCHVKTDRIDKFVKMKTWPEAARRIKEMIPLLPFDELKYLSSQLMAELDKTT